MASWLPEHALELLEGPGRDAQPSEGKEFGATIKFSMDTAQEEEDLDWLGSDDDDAVPIKEDFDMRCVPQDWYYIGDYSIKYYNLCT